MMKSTIENVSPANVSKTSERFFSGGDRTAPFFQPKLMIGAVNDAYEREADHVAEQVVKSEGHEKVQRSFSITNIQRKCAACEEEEDQHVQRKETAGLQGAVAPSIVHEAIRSPGNSLDANTRSFMEGRLGYDFSPVTIHTGALAAKSAQTIQARAFTSGTDIIFNEGEYSPGTQEGRRLLAHELTHVVQQTGAIYRCPDPASERTFDTRATAIRSHAAYLGLDSDDRDVAETIMTTSRTRDDCVHLVDQLTLLFNTPDNPPGNTAAMMRQETADSLTAERARLATPEGSQATGAEEAATASTARRWTRRQGDGAFYFVDRSDPNNLVVRAQVRLQRTGVGTATDVANTVALEDAIEKAAATRGYILDIVFVNSSGPDVFDVEVNPDEWTVSTNWVGGTTGLAHELHHLLGLDDRYDYIEAHAGNADMDMPDRLHWFNEQLGRAPDPEGDTSLMGNGTALLDDDVCRVAQLDTASCVAARTAPNPAPVSANPCPSPGFVPTLSLPPLSLDTPVPSPPLVVISPETAETTGSIVLDSFVLDSAALTRGHLSQLRSLAGFLRLVLAQHRGILTIVGHADATGQESHNLSLGQLRADMVMMALMGEHIPADIMFTCSAGDTQLLFPTSRAEPRNRRVEIRLQVIRPAPSTGGTGAGGTGALAPDLLRIIPEFTTPPDSEAEFNDRLRRMLTEPLPSPAETPTFNEVLRRSVTDVVSPILNGMGLPRWLRDPILDGAYSAVDRGIESALGSMLDAAGIHGEYREAIETSVRALRDSHIPR